MAAEVLKEFLARLGFDVDEKGLARFNQGLASATTRLTAFGLGIQAAAAALYAGVYKVAQGQAEMLELSEATGVAVERLGELGYVAEQTGSSQDALASSLRGLQKNMADATLGRGGIEAFTRLGIRIKDANGHLRATDDVLMDVGQKIKGMDRGRQEMFLSQLGIDPSMVKALTSDIGGLQQSYQQMYAAAGVDAQQAAEKSRAFVGSVNSLIALFKMLGQAVASIFVVEMGEDVERFRKTIMENVGKIMPVIQMLVAGVVRLGKFFGGITVRILGWVGDIVAWFNRLDGGTQKIILGVLGFAAAWKVLNLGFLASPLGAIITGLLAIVAIVDDFITYMQGGESFFDWGPWAGTIMQVVDALRPLMDALGRLWGAVKGPLMEAFQWWADYMLSMIGGIAKAFGAFITAVVRLFTGDFAGALDAVMEMFGHLFDVVSNAIDAIGGLISDTWDGLKSLVGLGDDEEAPALGPSPALAAAASGGGGDTNVNAQTVINVDGSANPEATARAVGRQQSNVNADLVRHTKGAAR